MSDFFSSQWGMSILFFIAGSLFTILISYVFYRMSQRSALPVYDIANIEIISVKDKDLFKNIKITYKEEKIDNINKLIFSFWNYGRKPLRKEDIVIQDRVRIVFNKSNNILSSRILSVTKQANGFTITTGEDNIIIIDFDYIDPLDGVIIEINYTGERYTPSIEGAFIGIEKGFQNYKKVSIYKVSSILKITALFSSFIILLLISNYICSVILEIFHVTKTYGISSTVYFAFMGLIVFIMPKLATFLLKNRRYPQILDIDKVTHKYK